MKFSVMIVSPPRYPHSECFREIAETLQSSLRNLGYEADITKSVRPGSLHIVLGGHLLVNYPLSLPRDSIFYNLEQVTSLPDQFLDAYVRMLGRYTVWDYSRLNKEAFFKKGLSVQYLLPIGYSADLSRIPDVQPKDIDVLFIGSMNDRRERILRAMTEKGIKTTALFNTYGSDRDQYIARSKILLNMHFYEAKILEVVRISYYLANKICVLSEESSDPQDDAEWSDGVYFSPYEKLVAAAIYLLSNKDERINISERGYSFMQKRRLESDLSIALQDHQLKSPVHVAAPSQARLSLCACGSGKRFKHCCGQLF